MNNSAEQTQILFEIAMSIGNSLDLRQMLKMSLSTLLKKLNCSAGSIHIRRQHARKFSFESLYSIPRDIGRNPAHQSALQNLAQLAEASDLAGKLPFSQQCKNRTYGHILELPNFGVIILVKTGRDLDPFIVKSLKPLLQKLANACRACLQNEELADAHAKMTTINLQLEESRNNLNDTLLKLRRVANRNQAILDAIPDSMFYLSRDGQVLDHDIMSDKDLPSEIVPGTTMGRKIRDVFPADVVDLTLRYIDKTLDSGAMQIFEYQLPGQQEPQEFEVRLVVSEPNEVLAIIRDITERKKAEQAIQVLAKVPDENPDPILRIARDGTILYANEASRGIIEDWQTEIDKIAPDYWWQIVADALNLNSPKRLEISHNDRIFLFVIAPVPEADYANLYGQDITERKQVEDAWRKAEERLSTIVKHAPIILFALDRNGIFTLSEGKSLSKLGRKPGQVVGQSIFEVYRHNPEILDHIKKAMRGKAQSFLTQIGDIMFDTWYEPHFDQHGQVAGLVGTAYDITDRKRAEQTLSTLLDTVGEGIITIDSSGKIVMVNQEVQNIWGYSHQELMGQKLEMLMPEQYRAAHAAGLQRYQATGEPHVLDQRIELEGLRKDGTIFPLEVHIKEIKIGERLLFTAAVRDITERRELDKMRDDFVSTVSHELRTPLASIMGFLETILNGQPGPLTEIQERFLQNSYRSSERLLNLIEEILTVSQIERGTFRLEKNVFFPTRAVESVQEMVASLAEAKTITFNVTNEWASQEKLTGDQNRLEQVITNLISNAIKFTPEEGDVRVQSYYKDGSWHFNVRDTGIGIPQTEIPRLFQRFYRASNATEAQIQGTGLGLYVCQAIIEQHGGQIGLDSKPGQGSTAWFVVPVVAD